MNIQNKDALDGLKSQWRQQKTNLKKFDVEISKLNIEKLQKTPITNKREYKKCMEQSQVICVYLNKIPKLEKRKDRNT